MVLRKKPKDPQNLSLDKGYGFRQTENENINRWYTPPIRHRGERRRNCKNVHRV